MSRADARWAILLVLSLVAVLLSAGDPPTAQATHLCGGTGSPLGPFDFETYEAADWRTTYGRTFALAGFNRLFPDVSGFALPQLETGDRSAGSGQLRDPYIPPTLLKAIAWIESSWAQADYSVPYGDVGPVLVSHDCGYGLMQITSGMENVTGVPNMDQAMIGGHYAFNIARGARILADKWNAAPEYRPLVGDRDPTIVENWYYAVWSYNGFVFKNHPRNPAYSASRLPYKCDGTQPRSDYPYQELVFGCMANPPVVNGQPLWSPVEVHLPSLSDPAFDVANWDACAIDRDCAAMDLATPGPSHTDPASTSLTRSQVIGSPKLSVSPGELTLVAPRGGKSASVPLTVSNPGTGPLSWRATTSQPWLKVTDFQGVSLGTDLGGQTSGLAVYADAAELADGIYTGKVKIDSLYAGQAPREVTVTLQVSPPCNPFSDLLAIHWACSQIEALYAANITNGCATDPLLYCPNDVATRAEMAAFILKAMGHGDHLPSYQGYFTDVPPGRWYTGYVEHLWEHGIATGYPDGTYRPDSPTSRAELAVLVLRGLGETPAQSPSGKVFSDVPASHWAAGYIERLAQWGIATGYPDGTFRPEKALSRAEAAAIIARAWSVPYVTRAQGALLILRAMGHDGHLPPFRGFFSDVPPGQWYTGYVEHLREHDIASGYPDGTFRPDSGTTRAEIAVAIVRGLGKTPIDNPTGTVFSDVPASHWAAGYIERLAQLGIASGYADGTFRPEKAITRDEITAFLDLAWPSS